jgi:hypothetical protein
MAVCMSFAERPGCRSVVGVHKRCVVAGHGGWRNPGHRGSGIRRCRVQADQKNGVSCCVRYRAQSLALRMNDSESRAVIGHKAHTVLAPNARHAWLGAWADRGDYSDRLRMLGEASRAGMGECSLATTSIDASPLIGEWAKEEIAVIVPPQKGRRHQQKSPHFCGLFAKLCACFLVAEARFELATFGL